MVRCVFNNGYQIDMSSKEIGLRAQNVITILGPPIDIIYTFIGGGGEDVYG